MTWDAETDTWIRPEHAGAIVTKAPKGWKDLFGAPEKSRGLTVVMLAYDWKDENPEEAMDMETARAIAAEALA